jgi:hypothetical protein
MVWPILISVSVIPGAFAAHAREPTAMAAAEAALALKNLRREIMVSSLSVGALTLDVYGATILF